MKTIELKPLLNFLSTKMQSLVKLKECSLTLTCFFLGAVPGAIVTVALFEWALVFLSAIVGAVLIVQGLPLERASSVLLLLVLAAIGVAVQARTLQEEE